MQDIVQEKMTVNQTDNVQFTWTDKEDEEIRKNGLIVLWVAGRSKAIQKFVEALSEKIGYKCDWSYTAGRGHIDVLKEGYNKVLEAISDEEWVKQFIVPYSKETYDNETYFEILKF